MRILVIGGNSYIARAFARHLPQGWECSRIHRNDLLSDYRDLPAEAFSGYDALLNCAAIVHHPHPDESLAKEVNTDLPALLALRAKEAGIKHFVHLSTVAVYGSAAHIDPTAPETPTTPYGRTKLEGDRRLLALQEDAFAVSVIRPPMVYGPDSPGNFHTLVRLIRRIPILPLGYSANRRSFIGIDNLTRAIEKVLQTQTRGILLVCDAERPSLAELSSAIADALGTRRLFVSPPAFLVRWLCRFPSLPFAKLYGNLTIDDSQTRRLLGDYALTPLDAGIAHAVHGEDA